MKGFALAFVILCRCVLAPLILMWTWNQIAWEFNLPRFGFTVPFAICVLRELLTIKVKVD